MTKQIRTVFSETHPSTKQTNSAVGWVIGGIVLVIVIALVIMAGNVITAAPVESVDAGLSTADYFLLDGGIVLVVIVKRWL